MRIAKKTTEGPIGVGTSFHAEMTGRGRVVPMTIRVTEFDRPHRIWEKVDMESMELTGGLRFEPFNDGTRMRWHWDLQPHGFLRFMGPVVGSMGVGRSEGSGRASRSSWRAGLVGINLKVRDARDQSAPGPGAPPELLDAQRRNDT